MSVAKRRAEQRWVRGVHSLIRLPPRALEGPERHVSAQCVSCTYRIHDHPAAAVPTRCPKCGDVMGDIPTEDA